MQPNGQYIDTAWELHRNYRLTMSLKLLVNTQELLFDASLNIQELHISIQELPDDKWSMYRRKGGQCTGGQYRGTYGIYRGKNWSLYRWSIYRQQLSVSILEPKYNTQR